MITSDEDAPFSALSSRDRVELAATHLLSSALIGAVIIALLFAAGHLAGQGWVMVMALVAGGFGWISQLAAANAVWSNEGVWFAVMTCGLLMAALSWFFGIALLVFA